MDNCCCCMTAPPHMHCGKKKENEKNIGLDFPIIFENWLNLWKYKHWKLVEAKLHTWYALYSALCVRVFVFFVVVVVCLFFIFQCSWFSVSSSIFFRCSIFFFLPYRYTLDFVTYTFETPFFFFTQISLHPYETVRTSCLGHVLNQLYFTSAW